MDGESAGIREWITVVLSLWSTFLFASILSGWASIQSFLEDDGVYEELCTTSCKERDSSMILMYARGQMMSILAYAFLNMVDRLGPIFLVILGGVLETLGLFLLGATDDLFGVAIILTGVGGSALMVHALKLAFVVSEKHFALVMTLVNCMVDGSSVIPAVLYQLYRFGMSRRQVFFAYGLLCFLLNAAIAFSWLGPSLRRLRERRSEETEGDGRKPRLHGLPFPKQVKTFEFAFAFVMFTTQAFAANSYLGFNKNLLSSLGDDDNVYTRLFCALLPASIFFAPLYGMSLNRKGFAFTFAITLALGLLWSSITLIPSLPVQMVAFLAFTNYRALLYSAYFTFIAHSFGSRTMGAVNAQLAALGAVLTYSIGACTEFSESWFGNLRGMSGLMLILLIPPGVMTLALSWHLQKHPTGDVLAKDLA